MKYWDCWNDIRSASTFSMVTVFHETPDSYKVCVRCDTDVLVCGTHMHISFKMNTSHQCVDHIFFINFCLYQLRMLKDVYKCYLCTISWVLLSKPVTNMKNCLLSQVSWTAGFILNSLHNLQELEQDQQPWLMYNNTNNHVADNKAFRQLVEKDFLFQSISNGAFSVDTFFFIRYARQ